MNSSTRINEFEAFSASPRQREKPIVPLTNVLILSTSPSPTPVDLFDALFKYYLKEDRVVLILLEDLSQLQAHIQPLLNRN